MAQLPKQQSIGGDGGHVLARREFGTLDREPDSGGDGGRRGDVSARQESGRLDIRTRFRWRWWTLRGKRPIY